MFLGTKNDHVGTKNVPIRPYKAIQDHTKSQKAMLSWMGTHMAMAVKSNENII